MRQVEFSYVFVMIVVVSLACSTISTEAMKSENPNSPKSTAIDEDIETHLYNPLIEFSTNIFNCLDRRNKNVVISPVSIQMALNMLFLGAKHGSPTGEELARALGYLEPSSDLAKIHESFSKLASKFKTITQIGLKERQNKTYTEHATDKKTYPSFYPSPIDKTPVLDLWTLIIAKNTELFEHYRQQVRDYYHSSVEKIDDEELKTKEELLTSINTWAKDAGFENGIMKKSDLDAKFKMLLLSAVRVQAFWSTPFTEHNFPTLFYNYGRLDRPVNDSKGLTIGDLYSKFVEFTSEEQSKSKYHRSTIKSLDPDVYDELSAFNFRILDIPMFGNVSYTIIVPVASGSGYELENLTQKLLIRDQRGELNLKKALNFINSNEAGIDIDKIEMPPFNFENDIDLIPTLRKMGIKHVFNMKSAQLTVMSEDALYVDKAKHQAMIEVNKIGLKAAGVTTVRVVPLMAVERQEPISMAIRNPYMFLIRFGKLPLFIGQVVKVNG